MLVKQAANVFDIFEYFAREKRSAKMQEIAEHFGWPRSSAFNLIQTLVERGYLYEPTPRGGFYPTPRWLALAQEISAAEPLPPAILALLRDLAEVTQETVWVAVPSGQTATLLLVIESKQPIRYAADPGRRVPIHGTASGQAIMCQMSEAQTAAILRKAVFERFGPGSPMSVEEVRERIDQSLKRGWFQTASAFSRDLGGVSVPLPVAGRPFSVTVAGPLFRIEDRFADTALAIHRAVLRHFGEDYFHKQVPQLHRLTG